MGAVGRWHDTAGYTILGLVFVGTIAIASLLAGKAGSGNKKPESRSGGGSISSRASQSGGDVPPSHVFPLPRFHFLLCLSWLLLVELGVEQWYRSHERDLVQTRTWSVRWPEQKPGFREVEMSEDVKATLRFDRGRQGTWPVLPGDAVRPGNRAGAWSMFFFRWEPGTTSILRARAHRPDVCLPNTGWRLTSDLGVRQYRLAGDLVLPFRHFRFVREVGTQRLATADAFFCQREDRVAREAPNSVELPAGTVAGWAREDRVNVVRQGLRNQGQQVLELVMLAQGETGNAEAEAKFADLLPEIVTID